MQRAERSTQTSVRAKLLTHAERIAPNYAPAQWAAGRLRVDDEWLTVEEAQARNAADVQLAEYEAMLREAADTPAVHKRLAKWCERNNLQDEARLHWALVLDVAPRDADALRALKLVWRNGEHLSRDEARAVDRAERLARRQANDWRRRISRWQKGRVVEQGNRDPAAEELRENFVPAAIPAFEQLAGELSESEIPRATRRAQLASLYAETLGETPTFEATRGLVRLAVLAPNESLRQQAAEGLAPRPRNETMPMLLSGLRSTAESDVQIRFDPARGVALQHDVLIEGQSRDRALRRVRVLRTDPLDGSVGRRFRADRLRDPTEILAPLADNLATSLGAMARMQEEVELVETQLRRQNAAIRTTNERIYPVLTQITGESYTTPRDWWDYWSDYDGYEVPEYRPVDREYDFDSITYVSPYTPPPTCECFAAGTPVWTNKGLAPIETIQPGDFVLAKDLRSGELAFRGVLQTTTRDPSPMVEIAAAGETIRATVGHAFWVVGRGWRKAGNLSPVDVLAGPQAPIEVAAVTSVEDARAYNLVVEGASTYYVGKAGVLVHDNTRRRPEDERLAQR